MTNINHVLRVRTLLSNKIIMFLTNKCVRYSTRIKNQPYKKFYKEKKNQYKNVFSALLILL